MPLTTRLLVVEKHEITREGIRSFLHPRCRVIAQMGYANEALAFLKTGGSDDIDLAIVGYALPDKTGAKLTQEITRDYPHIAVILFTDCDKEAVVAECVRSGAMGFVTKAEDARYLLEAVNVVCNGQTYYSPVAMSGVRNFLHGPAAPRLGIPLAPREQEVLAHRRAGLTCDEIALVMGVTTSTVKEWCTRIRKKFGAKNWVSLVNTLGVEEDERNAKVKKHSKSRNASTGAPGTTSVNGQEGAAGSAG